MDAGSFNPAVVLAHKLNHQILMEQSASDLAECIELQVPICTIRRCELLQPGVNLHVPGIIRRGGDLVTKNMDLTVRRTNEYDEDGLLFAIHIHGLDGVLTSSWQCTLDSIVQQPDTTSRFYQPALPTQQIYLKDHNNGAEQLTSEDAKSVLQDEDPRDSEDFHSKSPYVDGIKTEDSHSIVEVENVTAKTYQVFDKSVKQSGDDVQVSADMLPACNEGVHDDIRRCADLHGEYENKGYKVTKKPTGTSYTSKSTEKKSHQLKGLKFVCKFCLKHFDEGRNPLTNLQKHVMKRCPNLHNVSPSKEKTNLAGKKFDCSYCGKILTSKFNRDRHLDTCSKNPANIKMASSDNCEAELLYCDDCNWPTRTMLDLHKHRVQHHGATKKPRKRNGSSKPVSCRYCGEIFKFTSSRCNHELFKCSKNLNVTKSFFCRFCGTRCRTQDALGEHMESKHKDKKCTCKDCGLEFNSRNAKWHHVISAHQENTRRFTCTHCDHTYLDKRTLVQHMTKHFDERNVQCPVCGKCFKNSAQEKSHRRHVHEGIYRFHCDQCGHGVAKWQYLKSHRCGRVRRVQDGEKHEQSEVSSEPHGPQSTQLNPETSSLPQPPLNVATKSEPVHAVSSNMYFPYQTVPSFMQTLTDGQITRSLQMPRLGLPMLGLPVQSVQANDIAYNNVLDL